MILEAQDISKTELHQKFQVKAKTKFKSFSMYNFMFIHIYKCVLQRQFPKSSSRKDSTQIYLS